MSQQACQKCGAPTNLLRAGARYCSGACRVAAHRDRARAADPFPPAMTRAARWVRRDATKRPVRADTGRLASVTNPGTWCTYAAAKASARGVGLGWVLGNGIGAIDLDHCLTDDGHPLPWAREILEAHPEALLVEVSQSGYGLHIFTRMPTGPGIIDRSAGRSIETYPPDSGRYIAVTGRPLVLEGSSQGADPSS